MKKILVATDFSTRSDRALRRAVLLASQCDAHIRVAHVVEEDQPMHLIDADQASASRLLEETVDSLTCIDGIEADSAIETGDAFAGILQAAGEYNPDLILIGPHRRRFSDFFAGTTAERTIRRSPYPVLIANAAPSGSYNKAVLAIDMDEASRAAAKAVQQMSFIRKSDLTAMHMFDVPAVGLMRRAMEDAEAIAHYVDRQAAEASADFNRFLSAADMLGVERLLLPHNGKPATALLSSAANQGAELLVLGTSQRSGLERLVLGSVAQEVCSNATCDVLVIPATGPAQSDSMSRAA